MNILVIDDSEFTQEIIHDWLLETYSIKAILALSVKDGIKRIGEFKFDLIVCDFEMPDGNGSEVLKYLRELNSSIPFILFTGRYDIEISIQKPLIEVISDKSYETLFKVIQKQMDHK